MNAKTMTIIFVLLTFFILYSLFNTLISFAFSKQGVSALILTYLFYQIYKYRKNLRAKRSGFSGTYYDRINTYSNPNGYSAYSQYSENRSSKTIWQRIKDYIDEKKRDYYYHRFNKVWAEVQAKYSRDMHCPACHSELTVFTIDIKGCCNFCKTKLL